MKFCTEKSVELFDTEISVEYDFYSKNINPKAVIGFNSNALYTLHMLYPETACQTVYYRLQSNEIDRVNCELAAKMQEQGISIINVLPFLGNNLKKSLISYDIFSQEF